MQQLKNPQQYSRNNNVKMASGGVQLMEFLRSKHPTMAQVLEVVLGDIGITPSDTSTSTVIQVVTSTL